MNELENLLRSHIESSNKNYTEIKTTLAEIKTHGKYTKEKLDEHQKHIEDWKAHKNKIYGAVVFVSALFAVVGNWIIKKLGL